MTTVRKFQIGETVPIWCETKTWAGAAASPDQGIKVTVVDPDGTTQVDESAMTESETGVFVYYFTPESSDPLGWWRVRCLGQDGLASSAKYTQGDGGFTLE